MHGMHARLPKHFVLEERLERYRDAIEPDPYHWRGHWARACAPAGATPFREARLDLGCGKGSFTVEAARREPDVLFVGMDSEPVCIAYAAQRAVESDLPNVVFVPGTGMRIREMFAEGELGRIYLNFPTPFPRKRESHLRLVNLERLMDYRHVLAPGAEVCLRTDSLPLREFALTQWELAGYCQTWRSDDARAERPELPTSEYELRLSAQGAKVFALFGTPREPAPKDPRQTAEMSLACYIPQDLSAFDGYAPHGMQATVQNLRNRAARTGGDWSHGITR